MHVGLFVACGEEHDGHVVAFGAQASAHLEPVEVGKFHIEYDEIDWRGGDVVDGFAAVGCRRHFVAGEPERVSKEVE